MKKLITLCLLLVATFSLHAQQLSFDETVKYINDIFSENTFYYFPGSSSTGTQAINMSANKDGKVIIYNGKVTINSGKVTLGSDKDGPIGSFNLFDIGKFDIGYDRIYLYDKSNAQIGKLSEVPAVTANRIQKALEYLRTLCNKNLDPFAN